MKAKTKEQIEEQINDLKDIKKKIRPKNVFGDSYLDAIDAQIMVLRSEMKEAEIYDRGEDKVSGWKENVVLAALEARDWLDGCYYDHTDLVESWQILIVK